MFLAKGFKGTVKNLGKIEMFRAVAVSLTKYLCHLLISFILFYRVILEVAVSCN